MSTVLSLNYEFTAESCFKCAVVFWMPTTLYDTARRTKQEFWCPNGHRQAYIEGEVERLKKETEKLRAQAAQAESRAAMATNRADGLDRKLRRVEKRVKNGVCPCCNRTFTNLGRHIHTKHPEFAKEPTP